MNVNKLLAEKAALAHRLQEAEDALVAIRNGGVDAFVVQDGPQARVFTLETADRPYRILVENMQQGAVTLHADGAIFYCNRRLAEWLQLPEENFIGSRLADFVAPRDRVAFGEFLRAASNATVHGECEFQKSSGGLLPTYLTIHPLPNNGSTALCVLVTDLTSAKFEEQRRRAAAQLAEAQAQLETELADTKLLQGISAELIQQENVAALYEKIMDAAVTIMRSDFASMQQFNPRPHGGELQLLVHRGFIRPAAKFWERVLVKHGCACNVALRQGQRIIVKDVKQCDFMAGTEDLVMSLRTGIRAVQSTPLRSRSGEVLGIISTHWRKPFEPSERDLRMMDILARQAADLIERKQAEEAKARLADIVESSADAIVGKDLNGVITTWNRGAEQLFGYSAREAVGHSITMLIPPDRLDEERTILERIRRGERIEHYETVRCRKDGRLLDISLTISPIKNAAGKIVGASKIARDVTARKMAEVALHENQKRLNIALEAARAAACAKDQFLATVSHELRTPLTPVLITVSTLRRDKRLPAPVLHSLGVVERNVQVEARMVNDLLDLSRIAYHKLELNMARCDLHEIVHRALDVCLAAGNAKKLRILTQLRAQPHRLRADAIRLEQVFWNLIQNAVKFTPAGGKITISSRNVYGCVCVDVADTGCGIEAPLLEKIFEPFTQADGKNGLHGLGLGLAIAQRITTAHGGTLTAASKGRDRGALFTVSLPAERTRATSRSAKIK